MRKTFIVAGFFLAHKAGHESGHGLQHGKSRAFAAVEYNITHAHRFKRKKLQQPCVNAFVPAANNGQVFLAGKVAHHVLRQRAAAGGHEQHATGPFNGAQGTGQRLALHDHAGAAAVGAVVHVAVLVGAELPGIMPIVAAAPLRECAR